MLDCLTIGSHSSVQPKISKNDNADQIMMIRCLHRWLPDISPTEGTNQPNLSYVPTEGGSYIGCRREGENHSSPSEGEEKAEEEVRPSADAAATATPKPTEVSTTHQQRDLADPMQYGC